MIPSGKALLIGMMVIAAGTLGASAADEAAAQKLLTQAKAKEEHAEQLRSAAAEATQKASDDQMEAQAEERQSRILMAQALKLQGADDKKQQAFRVRLFSRKLSAQAHDHLVWARNAEQQAAQLNHNAEELRKTAAELKDQPAVATTLENEAKEAAAEADKQTQTAATDKYSAQSLEERAKTAWAEAEKLDPETTKQVAAPASKPPVAQTRQVH